MRKKERKSVFLTVLLLSVFFVFSTWLMFHTFSYNGKTHAMQLSSKVWSDFGASIPLIRSFSLGNNWPPEYPLFPGEPIRYHFLFFLFVGLLERMGLRIDWALNIPSIAGFFLLLVTQYLIAKKLFNDYRVALLSTIFFLFNGSLSFLRFFQLHPLSLHTIPDIVYNREFPAFAPWGPGDVSAFWNLNIYTNQRHLALAFAIALFFILMNLMLEHKHWKKQWPWAIVWGLVIGAFPFFHQPTLLIFAILISVYFLLYPKLRLFLCIVGGISITLIIPQLMHLSGGAKTSLWYPGYLIHDQLTVLRFISYWFQNLGLHVFLIPIGFIIAPKSVRKALFPLFVIFVIPNLLRFSVEEAGGHKFFNFSLIMGLPLSAFILIKLFDLFKRNSHSFIRLFSYSFIGLFILVLTLSGIIDFFPVFNDPKGEISDIPANEAATWIRKNTDPNAVFLNSSYLYHPASIAGRKIFFGWPYFSWSAGYTEDRLPIMKILYESKNPTIFCSILKIRHIDYITVENTNDDPNLPKIDTKYFFSNFPIIYTNKDKSYGIIQTSQACK